MTFMTWFAISPIASFLRTFGASVLGWVIINADTLNMHPALIMGLVSALPALINWLNPNDPRYGTVNLNEAD